MRYFNNSLKNQGFTLLELVITIAIAGILMAVAVPSFSDAMRKSQHVSTINELLGGLNLARSEAIKRSTRTAMCARGADDETCGLDWSNGFITFTDEGDTAGKIDAGETILRVGQGPRATTTSIGNKARLVNTSEAPLERQFIRFGPRGTSNWYGSGYFILCDSKDDDAARAINISLSGDPRRARVENEILINSFGTEAKCGL